MNVIERLMISNPVDRLAANVTYKSNEVYLYKNKTDGFYHSSNPPEMIPIPKHLNRTSSFQNLTRAKKGRLTVVGYMGTTNPNAGAKWAVK